MYHLPNTMQFSLGEAIAALGLIFAVFQLSKPSWALVMDIKGKFWARAVWILSFAALIAILASSLLDPATDKTPVLYNPLSWQILGFLLFAAAPFFLFWVGSSTKKLFNEKTSERFYHRILQSISTGDAKRIETAVDIIWSNLDPLLDAIKGLDVRPPNGQSGGSDYQKLAYGLINTALSDTAVASYIATKRIDFIVNFTVALKQKRLTASQVGGGFRTIVEQLYTNPNSYLYRQSEYYGTGQYAPINRMIFGSRRIAVEFRLLQTWEYFRLEESIKLNEKFIDVFLLSMETAIKAGAFESLELGQQVAYMLYKLNEYAYYLVTSDKELQSFNINKKILQKIETFYGTTFPELYGEAVKANKVSDFELKAENEKRYTRKQSLTAAYAAALVEFLGNIGNYDKSNDLLRIMAMNAAENLITFPHDTGAVYSNIRNTFFENAWDAIKQNVEQGFYPAFIKAYIPIIYLHAANSTPKWLQDERKKFIDYMNKTVKPKIKNKQLMNNQRDLMESSLLPAEVEYDREKDKFVWLDAHGQGSEFK